MASLEGSFLFPIVHFLTETRYNVFSFFVFFLQVGHIIWVCLRWGNLFDGKTIWLMYQVFELGKNAPDKVLQKLYATLETLKHNGDNFAAEIQNRLRIIVRWLLCCALQFLCTWSKKAYSCCNGFILWWSLINLCF